MTTRKNSDLAKNEAIYTTLQLILSAFVVALAITFGVPALLSLVLNSSTTDLVKNIVTVFTSLITGVFFMWFSSERIKTTVSLAIEAAVSQKSKEYEEQHPDVKKLETIHLQEYLCAIPETHRRESSIRLGLSSPNLEFCNRRVGRDAVIRSLAYNDEFLKKIAFAAVKKTLEKTSSKPSEKDRETFFTDIYAYLKGWLMLSITHSHYMPIDCIQQRYPTVNRPDRQAYIVAVKYIKEEITRKPKFSDSMNQILNDRNTVDQAIKILDEYFDYLISELRKPTN